MSFRRIFNPEDKDANSFEKTSGLSDTDIIFTPQTLRQINRLRLNASRFLPGQAIGQRASLRRKPAVDFVEHRMYTAGDDVRFVDWKASARQEHIFVRLGEQPKEATVYLLLDCSASMGWGDPPKSRAALATAAALGFMALANGDRLVLHLLYGTDAEDPKGFKKSSGSVIGPLTGKGQFPGLLKHLNSQRFQGRLSLATALGEFARRAPVGGLVILISDCLDLWETRSAQQPASGSLAGLGRALDYLPAPTWDVVLLHLLHPEELKPALRGEFEMLDIETGQTANYDVTQQAVDIYCQRLESWRKQLEMACVEASAFYTLIQGDWALDREILPHLRDMNLLVPGG